jgi:hypothetical protein
VAEGARDGTAQKPGKCGRFDRFSFRERFVRGGIQAGANAGERRKEEALVRIGPEIGENGFRLRQIGWQEEAHPAERCVDIGGVRGLPLR